MRKLLTAALIIGAATLVACDPPISPPVNHAGDVNFVIDECTQADNRLCP